MDRMISFGDHDCPFVTQRLRRAFCNSQVKQKPLEASVPETRTEPRDTVRLHALSEEWHGDAKCVGPSQDLHEEKSCPCPER